MGNPLINPPMICKQSLGGSENAVGHELWAICFHFQVPVFLTNYECFFTERESFSLLSNTLQEKESKITFVLGWGISFTSYLIHESRFSCSVIICAGDKHQFYLCGGKNSYFISYFILLDILIGLPYTHLLGETIIFIYEIDARKANKPCYL